MNRIAIAGLCLVLLGCGKKDSEEPQPVHTMADGIWIYSTPDKAISVEFELKTTGSTLEIFNVIIQVNGAQGDAAGQISDVDVPVIDQIRINANDAALVFPYMISFVNCTISSNFNFISVAQVEYTYPWGTFKSLEDIAILRK